MKKIFIYVGLMAASAILSGCSVRSQVALWDKDGCAYTAIWLNEGATLDQANQRASERETHMALSNDALHGVDIQRFPYLDKDTCKVKPNLSTH